jgi:hypothetical protein
MCCNCMDPISRLALRLSKNVWVFKAVPLFVGHFGMERTGTCW